MTKPFNLRDRRRLADRPFGYRERCEWGAGDLPAPFAYGDVIYLAEPIRTQWKDEECLRRHYVVVYCHSADEGDGWLVRLHDGCEVSHRIFLRSVESSVVKRSGGDPLVMSYTVLETADPEGLALREGMLADGWTWDPPRVCPECGR